MYGIIHKAIRSAVLEHADKAVWEAVLKAGDLTEEHFLSPAPYDDAVTYGLVETVARTMDVSVPDALRLVGKHWVDYAKGAGYGQLFSMAGGDLRMFLSNLDRMHSSLQVTLSEARMPSFKLQKADALGYEVLYWSEREGLASFVEGILHGVCLHYGEQMDISWAEQPDGIRFVMRRAAAAHPGHDSAEPDALLTSTAA